MSHPAEKADSLLSVHDHLTREEAIDRLRSKFMRRTNRSGEDFEDQMATHIEGALYRIESDFTGRACKVFMIDPKTGRTLSGRRFHLRISDRLAVGLQIYPLPAFPEYQPDPAAVANSVRNDVRETARPK